MIIETKKICKNYSNCVDKTNNMGYYISCLHEITKKKIRYIKCTSGSVVEYRLAKARVAGSNPVSCLHQTLDFQGFFLFSDMCTLCALFFLALSTALFQSFIHNIQVLLFCIRIVNIAEGGLFIDLSKNITNLIKWHSRIT